MHVKKKYVPAWFARKKRISENVLNTNLIISIIEDQANSIVEKITNVLKRKLEDVCENIVDLMNDEIRDIQNTLGDLKIPEVPNEIYETNEIVKNVEQKVLSISDSVESIDNTMESIEYSIDERALVKIKEILESGKSAEGILKAIHKMVALVVERQYYSERNKNKE